MYPGPSLTSQLFFLAQPPRSPSIVADFSKKKYINRDMKKPCHLLEHEGTTLVK